MAGAKRRNVLRAVGLGVVTGAANDDPCAIGTVAQAGAKLGPSFLWTAPATAPLMFVVVYLSSKLGQVTGKGLFGALRDHLPRGVVHGALALMLIGYTVEAAANLAGMAAAAHLMVPIPRGVLVVGLAAGIFVLQVWGSYRLIRRVFRWLALTLFAYAGAAVLARPDLREVVTGTLLPRMRFDREGLMLLVAVMGTRLSAYLYSWQSNQEVEEEIAKGRTRLQDRVGATDAELGARRRDLWIGVAFSNLVTYFIMLATGSTLYRSGVHEVATAAEAAQALRPLAGGAAELLFTLGVVGVGVLAVPVMTSGAAYDLCQTLGWRHGLHAKPREAKRFYAVIGAFTAIAVASSFLGLSPMRALVWAGVVQAFAAAPMLVLVVLLTSRRAVMGDQVNTRFTAACGWITVVATFAAPLALVVSWIL